MITATRMNTQRFGSIFFPFPLYTHANRSANAANIIRAQPLKTGLWLMNVISLIPNSTIFLPLFPYNVLPQLVIRN